RDRAARPLPRTGTTGGPRPASRLPSGTPRRGTTDPRSPASARSCSCLLSSARTESPETITAATAQYKRLIDTHGRATWHGRVIPPLNEERVAGSIVSHYRLVERSAAAAWASSDSTDASHIRARFKC